MKFIFFFIFLVLSLEAIDKRQCFEDYKIGKITKKELIKCVEEFDIDKKNNNVNFKKTDLFDNNTPSLKQNNLLEFKKVKEYIRTFQDIPFVLYYI